MEIKDLLNTLNNEGISHDDAEQVLGDMTLSDLVIPSTISVENTLAEINSLTKRFYELHNKQKRDPTPLTKLVSLLELKGKMLGMMSVKPDVQEMIDSEINTFKRRFIELASLCIDHVTMETLTQKLTNEGL